MKWLRRVNAWLDKEVPWWVIVVLLICGTLVVWLQLSPDRRGWVPFVLGGIIGFGICAVAWVYDGRHR